VIISFEGIDGTGKETQAKLLKESFEELGIECAYFDFPAYDSFVGAEIGNLLSSDSDNKEFDALNLPPKLMAMLFALDRMQFFEKIKNALASDKVIITNRNSLSNSVFQSIRAGKDISGWVEKLEHEALGLPRPDCYVVLLGDMDNSKKLVASKGGRVYTESHDIYEKNDDLLLSAQELYKKISPSSSKKITVNCLDSNGFRSRKDIHEEIFNLVRDLVVRKIGQTNDN
jgi:dTMP kinase